MQASLAATKPLTSKRNAQPGISDLIRRTHIERWDAMTIRCCPTKFVPIPISGFEPRQTSIQRRQQSVAGEKIESRKLLPVRKYELAISRNSDAMAIIALLGLTVKQGVDYARAAL
jgi:hypothetical protein